jgi:hypothetical protein
MKSSYRSLSPYWLEVLSSRLKTSIKSVGWAIVCLCGLFVPSSVIGAEKEQVDASDPTKIYTFAGGGLKYNDYTNGEYMSEVRLIGNIGLSQNDMLLFELGYGWHQGDQTPGKSEGLTNARFRYFHNFEMDYELDCGYRGMGFQADLQLAGELKGTDGQNQIVVGVMPVFALGGDWNLYLMANVANAWDKKFEYWNGIGPSITAQIIYSPQNWWPGAQIRIVPTYTYFVAGDLKGDGSGDIEFNIGGEFTPSIMWDITFQQNLDVDLNSYRRERSSELKNDWNLFLNVTRYF